MSGFDFFCESGKLKREGGVGYPETTVVFPLTELDLFNAETPGMYGWTTDSVPFKPTIGQSYKVTWNGVEYNCTAFEVVEDDGFVYRCLGNADIADSAFGDTGEPFLIMLATAFNQERLFVYTAEPTATMSVSTETIHTIKSKYLPPVTVDMDELGLTNVALLKFNEGGGRENLPEGNAYGIDIKKVCQAFPLAGDYVCKITVPDLGTMIVKPVYTLFVDNGFRTAHFDSYIYQGGVLTKFYVRINGQYDNGVLVLVNVDVGFYT